MRTAIAFLVIALTATPAAAQAKEQTTTGSVDFGARGSSITGDSSRFERYRDLGDGMFLDLFRVEHAHRTWLFGASAANLGRRDQRFAGSIVRPGKLKLWGQYDEIPMLLSRSTRALFIEDLSTAPNVLTIPDSVQTLIQNAAATAKPGVIAANSFGFTTESQRRTGSLGLEMIATPELTFRTHWSRVRREGTLPYGGSFGHSSLVEMPAPIRHNLTDFDASAEYAAGKLLVRGGVAGSWFQNDVTTVEFDNPFRATDLAATPSRGRLSLAPTNSFINGNVMASITLPRRSRVTAFVSTGLLKDDDAALMPQTINSVNLPALTALPRATVDGEARTTGAKISFTSRPTRQLDFSASYRLYDYDNRTPEFVLPQRVSYDNAPGAATFSTIGGGVSPLVVETEPFGIKRQTFDVEARVRPDIGGATAIGFTRSLDDRSHRFFESTTENTTRVTYDLTGHAYFTVRAKYEHGAKRGEVTDEARLELFNIGEQPDTRHFDIASRDRDRFTLIGTLTPLATLSVNGSIAAGRDDFLETRFGLRDNRHRVYSAGVDATPAERVTFSASYSFEKYDALQHSRQVSSPPSGANILSFAQFLAMSVSPTPTQAVADARYDWAANGADRVHSAIAAVEVNGIGKKLDLRFSYDYNRARALYSYSTGANIPLRTLPEDIDPTLTALPALTQLPLIRSETARGTVDAVYSITPRIGLGVSYWYEDYKVTDFTLDVDATPDLARGSSLLLGYLYRPYTAHVTWARLIVRW